MSGQIVLKMEKVDEVGLKCDRCEYLQRNKKDIFVKVSFSDTEWYFCDRCSSMLLELFGDMVPMFTVLVKLVKKQKKIEHSRPEAGQEGS